MEPAKQDMSIPDLLSDLVHNLGDMFRTEGKLARAEITQAINRLVTGGEMVAAGGLVLLVAFLVIVQALVIVLANYVGAGWASVIVAGVLMAIGAMLILKGKKAFSASSMIPDRAIGQAKRDVNLVKEQV